VSIPARELEELSAHAFHMPRLREDRKRFVLLAEREGHLLDDSARDDRQCEQLVPHRR
jgi:hypothetical protein